MIFKKWNIWQNPVHFFLFMSLNLKLKPNFKGAFQVIKVYVQREGRKHKNIFQKIEGKQGLLSS